MCLKIATKLFFITLGPRKVMSSSLIPCTNDSLDEFHGKMTVCKSESHLQNLPESCKDVLETKDYYKKICKCCQSMCSLED